MDNPSSEVQLQSNALSALQKIRPDLLGFVFQLSWLYLLFFNDAIADNAAQASATNIWYTSSALPLIVTLVVGIAVPHTFQTLAEGRLGIYGAPSITVLGTILYCVNLAYSSLALIVLGGIFTGIGSAVLAVRWATAFGRATSQEILENFPLLLALVFVICVSCLYIPLVLRCSLVIILPILSGVLLQYAKHYAGRNHRYKKRHILSQTSMIPAWVKASSVALLCVALVALIGFNSGLLICFEIDNVNYAALFYIATAILILGFLGTLLFQMDRASVLVTFGLPLAIILITMLPFSQFLADSPTDALHAVGNMALELTLLAGCVLFALVTDRAVGRTFMIGRCTMAVFDLLGSLTGVQLAATNNAPWSIQVAAICLLLAVELLLGALLAGYIIIRHIQKSRKAENGETSEDASKTAEENATREDILNEAVTAENENENIPLEKSVEVDTAAKPEVASKSKTESDPTSLDARIDKIATEYSLSTRERDVFTLLAKGRSSARIQEDLCIAAGTVNYHTRNIYAKLGIHSRQEIIDLLENKQSVRRVPENGSGH